MLLIGSIGKIKLLPRALCFQPKHDSIVILNEVKRSRRIPVNYLEANSAGSLDSAALRSDDRLVLRYSDFCLEIYAGKIAVACFFAEEK